jgi:hypothetical protein
MKVTDGMREEGVDIMWLCEEDLLNLGFSPSQITNERFGMIVDELRRYYIDDEDEVLSEIATSVIGEPEDKEDDDKEVSDEV